MTLTQTRSNRHDRMTRRMKPDERLQILLYSCQNVAGNPRAGICWKLYTAQTTKGKH